MGGMERSRYGVKGASTVPHIELDTGINAFYRRDGEGPPLVLIMGTGLDHRCWDGQVKEYRRWYDCIRFDNRGTGRTDSTGGDLSMRLLADDTASLMDKLGIRRAHVSGLSLGSCVAQELALARPDLVETLQLHGTWGKAHGYAARKFAAQVQILKAFDLRAAYEINVLWFLTPDYMLRHPERVDSQIEAIVRSAPSRDDLVRLYTANLQTRRPGPSAPDRGAHAGHGGHLRPCPAAHVRAGGGGRNTRLGARSVRGWRTPSQPGEPGGVQRRKPRLPAQVYEVGAAECRLIAAGESWSVIFDRVPGRQ